METRIAELEAYIIENKLGSDSPEYSQMIFKTRESLGYFAQKMIIKNPTMSRRVYSQKPIITSENITELYLRVLASVQQGNSITAAIEHSGYNANRFYRLISAEQKDVILNSKKVATYNKHN